jgi:PAS domain-containing protein
MRSADERGFLETIFNAIHEGVIVTDLQGKISYINRGACEFIRPRPGKHAWGLRLAKSLRGITWNDLLEDGKVELEGCGGFLPAAPGC